MFDALSLIAIALTFLLAGTVKGVIGLGLPTVSLALLAVLFDLTAAMALLLVPSFFTNLWQACVGGHGLSIVRRLWPFLALAGVSVWLGALVLNRVDTDLLRGLLGLLLVSYSGTALAGFRLAVPARSEPWCGPVFGVVNGVLTGMTGSFVVPGVLYLQALNLGRAMLIQAMGMLFTLSTLALGLALGSHDLLSAELGWISGLALAPAILGMVLGQHLRSRLSEAHFRKVFFVALIGMGGYMMASAALKWA